MSSHRCLWLDTEIATRWHRGMRAEMDSHPGYTGCFLRSQIFGGIFQSPSNRIEPRAEPSYGCLVACPQIARSSRRRA